MESIIVNNIVDDADPKLTIEAIRAEENSCLCQPTCRCEELYFKFWKDDFKNKSCLCKHQCLCAFFKSQIDSDEINIECPCKTACHCWAHKCKCSTGCICEVSKLLAHLGSKFNKDSKQVLDNFDANRTSFPDNDSTDSNVYNINIIGEEWICNSMEVNPTTYEEIQEESSNTLSGEGVASSPDLKQINLVHYVDINTNDNKDFSNNNVVSESQAPLLKIDQVEHMPLEIGPTLKKHSEKESLSKYSESVGESRSNDIENSQSLCILGWPTLLGEKLKSCVCKCGPPGCEFCNVNHCLKDYLIYDNNNERRFACFAEDSLNHLFKNTPELNTGNSSNCFLRSELDEKTFLNGLKYILNNKDLFPKCQLCDLCSTLFDEKSLTISCYTHLSKPDNVDGRKLHVFNNDENIYIHGGSSPNIFSKIDPNYSWQSCVNLIQPIAKTSERNESDDAMICGDEPNPVHLDSLCNQEKGEDLTPNSKMDTNEGNITPKLEKGSESLHSTSVPNIKSPNTVCNIKKITSPFNVYQENLEPVSETVSSVNALCGLNHINKPFPPSNHLKGESCIINDKGEGNYSPPNTPCDATAKGKHHITLSLSDQQNVTSNTQELKSKNEGGKLTDTLCTQPSPLKHTIEKYFLVHPPLCEKLKGEGRLLDVKRPFLQNAENKGRDFPEYYFSNTVQDGVMYKDRINEIFLENPEFSYSEKYNIHLQYFNIYSIFYNPAYCMCKIKQLNSQINILFDDCYCFPGCECLVNDQQPYSIFHNPAYCACIISIYNPHLGEKLENKCYCPLLCICQNSNILEKISDAIIDYEEKSDILKQLHMIERNKLSDSDQTPRDILSELDNSQNDWVVEQKTVTEGDNEKQIQIYHTFGFTPIKSALINVGESKEKKFLDSFTDLNSQTLSVFILDEDQTSLLKTNLDKIDDIPLNVFDEVSLEKIKDAIIEGVKVTLCSFSTISEWENFKENPCKCFLNCLCYLSKEIDYCMCKRDCQCKKELYQTMLTNLGEFKPTFESNWSIVKFLNVLRKNSHENCNCSIRCKCSLGRCKCQNQCICTKFDPFEFMHEDEKFSNIFDGLTEPFTSSKGEGQSDIKGLLEDEYHRIDPSIINALNLKDLILNIISKTSNFAYNTLASSIGLIKLIIYTMISLPMLSLVLMTTLLLVNKEAFLLLLLFISLGFFRIISKSNVEEQSQLRKVIIQNRAKRKIQKSQIKAWKVRFKNYKARQHLTNTRAVNKKGQLTEKVEVQNTKIKLDAHTPLMIPLYLNGKYVPGELDSGSGRCLISKNLMIDCYGPDFLYNLPEVHAKIKLVDVQHQSIPIYSIKLSPILFPNFGICKIQLIVVDDNLSTFLIGRDAMLKTKMSLNYSEPGSFSVTYAKQHNFFLNKQGVTLAPFEERDINFRSCNVQDNNNNSVILVSPKANGIYFKDTKVSSGETCVKVKNITNHTLDFKRGDIKVFAAKRAIDEPFPFISDDELNKQFGEGCWSDGLSSLFNDFLQSSNYSKFLNNAWLEHHGYSFEKTYHVKNTNITEDYFMDKNSKNNVGLPLNDYYDKTTQPIEEILKDLDCAEKLKPKVAKIIQKLQLNSRHAFDVGKQNPHIEPLHIRLKKGVELPKNTKIYRGNIQDQLLISAFVQHLVYYGLARVASIDQQFGSPCFLVARQGNSAQTLPRLVIDIRGCNACIDNSTSIVTIEPYQTLNEICSTVSYCSVIDLKNCYYSLSVSDETLASGINNIITTSGAYTLLRCITGMSAVPALLQQLVTKYLHLDSQGGIDPLDHVINFFDDVTIFSLEGESLDEHFEKIEKVLERLSLMGFKIGLSKCTFARDLRVDKIKILGFEISRGKIVMPKKKLDAILNLKMPTCLKDLQVFIGSLGYFKNLLTLEIHGYLQSLHKNTKAAEKWEFFEKSKEAFLKIKDILAKELQYTENISDPSLQIILSDASGDGVGGSLLGVDLTTFLPQSPIESTPLEDERVKNMIGGNDNVSLITEDENIFRALFKACHKLNFTLPSDQFKDFLHHLAIQAASCIQFGEYLLREPDQSVREALKDFSKKSFNTNEEELNCNPFLCTYFLRTLALVLRRKLVFLSPYDGRISSYYFGKENAEEIVIFNDVENNNFIILNIHENLKIGDREIRKTFKKFDIHSYKEKEILDCFFKQLKYNPEFYKYAKIQDSCAKSIESDLLAKTSSAHMELLAIQICLQEFESKLQANNIYALSDNLAAVKVLSHSKQPRRTKKLEILSMKLQMYFGSKVKFLHVSGFQNFADFLSRLVGEDNLEKVAFPPELSIKNKGMEVIQVDFNEDPPHFEVNPNSNTESSVKLISSSLLHEDHGVEKFVTKSMNRIIAENIQHKSNQFWAKVLGTLSGALNHIYSSQNLFEVFSNILTGNYVSLVRNIIGVLLFDIIPRIREIFNIRKTNECSGELNYVRNVKPVQYMMSILGRIIKTVVSFLQYLGSKIFEFIIGDSIQEISLKLQEKIIINRVTADWVTDPTIPRFFSLLGLIIKNYFFSFISRSRIRTFIYNLIKILTRRLFKRCYFYIEVFRLAFWNTIDSFNVRKSMEKFLDPLKPNVISKTTQDISDTSFLAEPPESSLWSRKFSDVFDKNFFIAFQHQEKKTDNLEPGKLVYVKNKILLPKKLYIVFTLALHAGSGHIGPKRLYRNIITYYHVENKKLLLDIVENFCKNCYSCLRNKPLVHKNLQGSVYNNKVNGTNQLIAFDMLELEKILGKDLGKHPQVTAVLVICDVFSKYMTLYPMEKITSISVKNALANYFTTHGASFYVIADNATVFTSKLIKQFFEGTGVTSIKSSPLSSKSRGFIERRIRTLQTLLRIYWDQYGEDKTIDVAQAISVFGYSLNNVPYEQSILSPYNIQFGSVRGLGADIEGPKNYIFQKQYLFAAKSLEERLGEKVTPLLNLIEETMEKFKEKKLKKLKEDNLARRDSKIRENDYCLVKDHSRTLKYYAKQRPIFYHDVFKVIKRSPTQCVVMNMMSHQQITRHINDLKLIEKAAIGKYEIPTSLLDRLTHLTSEDLEELSYPNLTKNRTTVRYPKDSNEREEIELDDVIDEEGDELVVSLDAPDDPLPTIYEVDEK